jgi:hypothetical protein
VPSTSSTAGSRSRSSRSASGVTGAPSLDVVVVSYRCEGLLRDCLASLRANPASAPTHVHVVDNASRDGTA